ncbi:hypothetical protein [Amycolatopsis sp. A1MSW2902]
MLEWIRALLRRPPTEHQAPEGTRWPAVSVFVLIVDLVDIADKVLGFFQR